MEEEWDQHEGRMRVRECTLGFLVNQQMRTLVGNLKVAVMVEFPKMELIPVNPITSFPLSRPVNPQHSENWNPSSIQTTVVYLSLSSTRKKVFYLSPKMMRIVCPCPHLRKSRIVR